MLKELLRILRVYFRDSALLVPHKRTESDIPERAVISAVDNILIHEILSSCPFFLGQIKQIVDRLISVHNNADREVCPLKREQIGRKVRLNICRELSVTIHISNVLPLEDLTRSIGVVSCLGNSIGGLKQLARGSTFLNIIPRKPLDTLFDLHIWILKLIRYLAYRLLDIGIAKLFSCGYKRGT